MSKRITPTQTFSMFNTMKLTFNGKYNFLKYGFYSKRFGEDAFSKSYMKSSCLKLNRQYPFEDDIKNIFASNLVRNPGLDITKIDPDCSINLRRYASSQRDFIDDTKDLFRKYTLGELLNNNEPLIIDLLSNGIISPEWFAIADRLFPISSLLDKSDHFMWSVLKDRLSLYKTFVILDSVDSVKNLRESFVSIIK